MTQMAMEWEVKQQDEAGRYERSPPRTNPRNGCRGRPRDTRVGSILLEVPELRSGTCFPIPLDPRRPTEKALLAVIQQAYIEGVSTRKVGDLLQSLGLTRIDKSRVSQVCKAPDEVVDQFRSRPLGATYPYLWLDEAHLRVRRNHRMVNEAVVMAIGARHTAERGIPGFSVGMSEEEALWQESLRALVRLGLKGVRLVISDAHEGPKAAISKALGGATWQRCRVRFMRKPLAHVPRRDKAMVAAAVRTLFAQPKHQAGRQQLAEVVKAMYGRWPKAVALLGSAQ
jgi:transposase-like protein